MKFGNFEVPDEKKIIFGFPDGDKESMTMFRDVLKNADKENSKIVLASLRFQKVAETDTTLIINVYRDSWKIIQMPEKKHWWQKLGWW